jgi:hypothetical protein
MGRRAAKDGSHALLEAVQHVFRDFLTFHVRDGAPWWQEEACATKGMMMIPAVLS